MRFAVSLGIDIFQMYYRAIVSVDSPWVNSTRVHSGFWITHRHVDDLITALVHTCYRSDHCSGPAGMLQFNTGVNEDLRSNCANYIAQINLANLISRQGYLADLN